MSRRNIHIDPVKHSAPIPMAAVIGNTLYSSGISGADPETGNLPESVDEQASNAMKNVLNVLSKANMTADDLIHITVLTKDNADRQKINAPWLELFPDENNRPARHQHIVPTLAFPLQLEIVAIKE